MDLVAATYQQPKGQPQPPPPPVMTYSEGNVTGQRDGLKKGMYGRQRQTIAHIIPG